MCQLQFSQKIGRYIVIYGQIYRHDSFVNNYNFLNKYKMTEIIKKYDKGDKVIIWQPAKCIHSGICFRGKTLTGF